MCSIALCTAWMQWALLHTHWIALAYTCTIYTHISYVHFLIVCLLQPYDHQRVVALYHQASKKHIQQAIDAAMAARVEWERTPFEHKWASWQCFDAWIQSSKVEHNAYMLSTYRQNCEVFKYPQSCISGDACGNVIYCFHTYCACSMVISLLKNTSLSTIEPFSSQGWHLPEDGWSVGH